MARGTGWVRAPASPPAPPAARVCWHVCRLAFLGGASFPPPGMLFHRKNESEPAALVCGSRTPACAQGLQAAPAGWSVGPGPAAGRGRPHAQLHPCLPEEEMPGGTGSVFSPRLFHLGKIFGMLQMLRQPKEQR